MPCREGIDDESRKEELLQRGVSKGEAVLLFANDEGGGAKVFLERFAVYPFIGILDCWIPVEPLVEPFVEFIRLHAFAVPFVDFGGQRLHEPLLVRRAELMLALVPSQPVIHRGIIEGGCIDRTAVGSEPFNVGNEFGDQVQGVRPRCEIFQVMHLLEELNNPVDLFCITAEPFFKVLPDLSGVEWQQGAGSVLFSGAAFTIPSKKECVLLDRVPEVVRATTDEYFALGKFLRFCVPLLTDAPKLRDELVGFIRSEVHGLFIETVEDDHCPVCAHEPDDIFRRNNAFIKRVFSGFNGVVQHIGQPRDFLFGADAG